MYSLHADRGFLCRVSPFRYLRIIGYVLLPEAFRSLSRLSSALSAKASTLRPYYFNRSRNDRITWSSVSSLMYSVTSAGFVFLFLISISLLTMKFEIWCLDSFPFLKMNSIINSCMKFSRYIRVSETISCIFYTSGLIDHAIQESLFLDRIIDKRLISLLKIRQPPIFPGRLQPGIVGRVSLNHRVRDGNGCCPDAHRHRNYSITAFDSSTIKQPLLLLP